MSFTGREEILGRGVRKFPYCRIQERHHVGKLRTPFLTLAVTNNQFQILKLK